MNKEQEITNLNNYVDSLFKDEKEFKIDSFELFKEYMITAETLIGLYVLETKYKMPSFKLELDLHYKAIEMVFDKYVK